MNYAWLSQIRIKPSEAQPKYIQLRDALRELITAGILQADNRLPSSRIISTQLGLHRQTVVSALDELLAEGWLVSIARKGIYVNNKLPQIKPLSYGSKVKAYPANAAFNYSTTFHPTIIQNKYRFGFDDGYPDIRIAPCKALGKAYTETLQERSRKNTITRIATGTGSPLLRRQLADTMRTYRGLPITPDNILLTHGSQMSIFLVASRLLSDGDNVIVTKPNYLTANNCFVSLGASLLTVSVDNHGMNVDEVEAVCRKKKVKCLYVTSHHHHPTTVTLSVERRIRLLQLADKYGFAIIEDDYDYDYHYENKPLLPIASNDKNGSVVYIGSFSKILSHAFRVGYIIAPQDFIKQVAIYRRLVDRQGDQMLEDALGKLFQNNVIKNHIRKATTLYKQRRDDTYELLCSELGNYLQCELPEGGLAFWAQLDKRISLEKLSARCAAKGLYIPDGRSYTYDKNKMNACRLGFASMNNRELLMAIEILATELRKQ